MASTGTTPAELLIDINSTIRTQTGANTITPTTHSDLLDNIVRVVSGTTNNGIFDIDNSGNTVPSSFEYNITDSIQQNGPQSYLRHDGREFSFVGEITNDRTYVVSQSNAITPFAGPVFMLNNSSLVGVSQRIDFFLENNSSGTGSTTNMNFRRQNISGNGSNWIDFITQDGNTQNLEFNSSKSGSANYGDVIVQNGNFVIKNLGTGTSVTNLGIASDGTVVSGSTGGGAASKRYVALITQIGTNPPTAKVLQNDLGLGAWSYDVQGDYILTINGAFTLDKTSILLGSIYDAGDRSTFGSSRLDNDRIRIASADNTGAPSNDIFLDTTLVIEVFTP
jgi:hypothetical protein